MRQWDLPRRGLYLDAGLYLVFTGFAGLSAVWSEFFGYRVWGACALPAYLFGLGQALVLLYGRPTEPATPLGRLLRSRRTPIGLTAIFGLLAPLVVLLITRVHNVLWSEQPEVWVVERSASLLFAHGTPYTNLATLGRPPIVDDYTPYGPAMTLFGIPRAVFGSAPLTDARVMFLVFAAVAVAAALVLLRRPSVPVRTLQLMLACPLTVLTVVAAGDDIAIAALMVLGLALLWRRLPVACGVVLGVAVSMKLTAAPALLVLAVAVLAGLGLPAFVRFLAAVVAVVAVLNVPAFLIDPASFVEHVVKFPTGMGKAHSPAASPLPGYLIAHLGPFGHTMSLVLLLAAGVAMAIWLVRRPPRTAADAAIRIAVGLFGAIMLAPATRYGYLVYPIALLGMALLLRSVDRPEKIAPAGPATPEDHVELTTLN